jgi:hypothetical protein
VQVAEKKLQPSEIPASYTGFSTKLLIKKDYGLAGPRPDDANLCDRVLNFLAEGLSSNKKGCDFGYALAADSCEGVTGVDACTVTALDVITAFAGS